MTTKLLTIALIAGASTVCWGQCPPMFPNCVYQPAQYPVVLNQTRTVQYQDVAGLPRDIEVQVRVPARLGVLPVVIWAHGGGDGRTMSAHAFETWARWTAEAGYITIAPAFRPRTKLEQAALCAYLGVFNKDECANINSPSWDRPFDIRAIIDALVAWNTSGVLRNRIDMARIAVGGHSAGSTGTLSVAGAAREFAQQRFPGTFFEDPRPVAFIGLSTAAPGAHGLFETSFNDDHNSWENIQRPLLWATGAGDAHELFPHGRAIGFDFLPTGNKYKLWVDSVLFGHGAFGDDVGNCGNTQPQLACTAFQATLRSAVFAFLDWHVQQSPTAQAYLQNGYAAQIVPGNVVSWTAK